MTATPFPFDFRARPPTSTLAGAVEQLWYARGTVPYTRERIAPTGSTVAVLIFGDAIIERADDGAGPSVRTRTGFVIGPHDRPVINEPTGETHAVGIVTTPLGCEQVLGIRPALLRGRVAPIEACWPAGAEIREVLLGIADPDAVLARLDAELVDRLGPEPPARSRVVAALAAIDADPTREIAAIAADLGISRAQLHRDVVRVVGTSPRSWSRQVRLRRLLADLDAHGDVPWSSLAAELGWYDQAHLIRDFRRHTGVTPTAYLAAQRGWTSGPDIDTAGFVPEG